MNSDVAANPVYRRHVWLLSSASDATCNRDAVFEYFGQHVQGKVHGNNKRPVDNDMPAATITNVKRPTA